MKKVSTSVILVSVLSIAVFHHVAFRTPVASGAAGLPCFFVTDSQDSHGNADSLCQTCRNTCASSRDNCKAQACKSNGGQSKGAQICDGVKNQKGYLEALKACEDQEKACWNRCDTSECKPH